MRIAIYFQTQECWNDDENMPLFEKGRPERYTVDQAIEIITKHSLVSSKCTRQPLRVRENASFLIDLKWFDNWEDVKADMNGVYSGILRCAVWTIECRDGLWSLLKKKKAPLPSKDAFHLVQNSKTNKAAPALARSIFLLNDFKGNVVNNVCLVQYHVSNSDGRVEDLQIQKHGNSRSTNPKPFYPLKKSTLASIRDNVTKRGSHGVYDDLRKKAGGAFGATNVSELPRGKQQIYNAKSRISSSASEDDVDELLKYARDKDDLILHHSDYPEDRWVLGTATMCSDLSKYTTSDLLCYPFSVDPTFKMGQFEVTPVVYKNLLLKSKRTNESPVFLGPTMIHHKKTYDTYRALAATCAGKCKGLSKAKGFITDGEETLSRAFEDELKNARSLRCFKHFESNCKEKLRTIGIREAKEQRFFLQKVFGVPGKEHGILDAVDREDLRKRLDGAKPEIERKEREVLKRKDDTFKPNFWSYLNNRFEMMSCHMVANIREEAGMVVGDDGKPVRCYTNNSESINNIMRSAKETFLKENPCISQLNKIQFTQNVFEVVHANQMEELHSAIAGLSDVYILADHARYLQVPADVWFEWTPNMREKYVLGVQKLSVADVFKQKDVPWPVVESTDINITEFRPLEEDFVTDLISGHGYSEENASALKKEVLHLLNHPSAIQRKASLQTEGVLQFEVASAGSRHGTVQVSVYSDHATCVCGRYKYDNICKHSLAVAAVKSILAAHLDFIRKKSKKNRNRTALAEHDVRKETAGKKGGKNKYAYRPARGMAQPSSSDSAETASIPLYSEIYHNENLFELMFLSEGATRCKSCHLDFCHRKKVIPFDVIFSHKERWMYPIKGDWSNSKPSQRETVRYYHASKKCLTSRFPYFSLEYIHIPSDVKKSLRDSHKTYLSHEFGLTFD